MGSPLSKQLQPDRWLVKSAFYVTKYKSLIEN